MDSLFSGGTQSNNAQESTSQTRSNKSRISGKSVARGSRISVKAVTPSSGPSSRPSRPQTSKPNRTPLWGSTTPTFKLRTDGKHPERLIRMFVQHMAICRGRKVEDLPELTRFELKVVWFVLAVPQAIDHGSSRFHSNQTTSTAVYMPFISQKYS